MARWSSVTFAEAVTSQPAALSRSRSFDDRLRPRSRASREDPKTSSTAIYRVGGTQRAVVCGLRLRPAPPPRTSIPGWTWWGFCAYNVGAPGGQSVAPNRPSAARRARVAQMNPLVARWALEFSDSRGLGTFVFDRNNMSWSPRLETGNNSYLSSLTFEVGL